MPLKIFDILIVLVGIILMKVLKHQKNRNMIILSHEVMESSASESDTSETDQSHYSSDSYSIDVSEDSQDLEDLELDWTEIDKFTKPKFPKFLKSSVQLEILQTFTSLQNSLV